MGTTHSSLEQGITTVVAPSPDPDDTEGASQEAHEETLQALREVERHLACLGAQLRQLQEGTSTAVGTTFETTSAPARPPQNGLYDTTTASISTTNTAASTSRPARPPTPSRVAASNTDWLGIATYLSEGDS
ncbi:hypothetical protein Agub_g15675, partial [Astrephomene gubernaculifera]